MVKKRQCLLFKMCHICNFRQSHVYNFRTSRIHHPFENVSSSIQIIYHTRQEILRHIDHSECARLLIKLPHTMVRRLSNCLLSFLLCINGLQDGLSLGLVTCSEFFDLSLHLGFKVNQPRFQFLVC